MRQTGEAVDANQVTLDTVQFSALFRRQTCCVFHLGALFDGRGDMVEADRALEEGEQGVGVDAAQLEAGFLHQH